ncbi:major capsid protein [Schinkia azotoformans]|uniref:major capsid protein n=1 Tax=Schinkia azotoformans TaxID=1454 RepID=UPI002DB867A3|nr:major capsid protein [Schinkia azotoformans]MEC1744126.1 major capsid protein [Schinkia azotoformans]
MTGYTTKTMLPAVQVMPHVPSFLRDTFFPRMNDRTFVTESVEFDYKKGRRKMAPFVAPRVGGVTVSRDGFQTKSLKPLRIAPQRIMTIDDISSRGMGENIYSQKTPAQRSLDLLATDLKELGEEIDRREEWMAAQILFTGKVIAKGYADNTLTTIIEEEINYGFDNFETLSGTDLWTDATSNPYEYLRQIRLNVLKNSGIAPNIAIFGEDAYAAFMKNPTIKELFDKLNIHLGQIQPSVKSDQVSFVAKLPELNLEIYLYNDWYIDESGNEQPFVPGDKILLGHTELGAYVFGAVTQLEQAGNFITYEGTRVPKFWNDLNADAKMVRLTSRPVPHPNNVDAWFVSTVV